MSKYIPGNQKHLTLEGHIYIETSLNKGLAFKDIVRSLGGNDFATPLPARKRTDFNPRSHEGNDIFEVGWIEDHKYFNPRSHEGNDIRAQQIMYVRDRFQSTFPRGERPDSNGSHGPEVDFNPRSHEGNDSFFNIDRSISYYFNPRSHEGNDRSSFSNQPCHHHFNPRSHEGNDGIDRGARRVIQISIHVPTRGTTLDNSAQTTSLIFQSTFPRGERRYRGKTQ